MRPKRPAYRSWVLLLVLLAWPIAAAAHGPGEEETHDQHRTAAPEQSETAGDTWLQEKTGNWIPQDAVFRNERGEAVTLGQLVDRPTLLLPVYYTCPKACSFDLANLAEAVRRTSHAPGTFRVISMSFNNDETPETAALVGPNFIQLLGRDFPEDGWSFLTGDKVNILKVTRAIGYSFKKQADGTYIHPSALAVLAADGRIIKYVYGSFLAGDVDLALAEAAKGTPATSIHRFLAFCFSSDPRQNQRVFTIIKIGAATILALGTLLFVRFLQKRKPSSNTIS